MVEKAMVEKAMVEKATVEKARGLAVRSWRGFIFLTAVVCLPLHAATIIVNPGGSIQTAINAANPGDTIQVAAANLYRAARHLEKPDAYRGGQRDDDHPGSG